MASELTYNTPIRSGIYSTFTSLVAPPHPSPHYIWVFASSGRTTSFILARHIIGIEGLRRLPGCPDSKSITGQQYTLFRGDVGRHPEGHWGRDKTLEVAKELANKVFKDHTRHMSYNDLSLPLGGYSHHDTHRTGRDIDINAKNGMSYNCNKLVEKDKFIQKAFTDLYGLDSLVKGKKPLTETDKKNDKNFPNLHCYGSGLMHIDAVSGF